MEQLPSEMVAHILTFLPGRDLNRFKQLSSGIRNIITKHQKEMQLIAIELECTTLPTRNTTPNGAVVNAIAPALVIRVKRTEICILVNNNKATIYCESLKYKGVFDQDIRPGVPCSLESFLVNFFTLVTITKLHLTSPWDNCVEGTDILVRCLKGKCVKRVELTEGDFNVLLQFEEGHFRGKTLLISTSLHLEMIARRVGTLGRRFPYIILKARKEEDLTRVIFYTLCACKYEIAVPIEIRIFSDLDVCAKPVEGENEEVLTSGDLDITTRLSGYPEAFRFYSLDGTKFAQFRIDLESGCTTVICTTHNSPVQALQSMKF